MKLNDLFYTVQGEGRQAGRAALFLRMPFCNLSCPWCDTEFDSFTDYSEEELGKILDDTPARFAVVTGGEPSMNKEMPKLVRLLKSKGFEVAMESNGQFLFDAPVDFLTISPKRWMNKKGTPEKDKAPFWFHPHNRPSEIKLVFDGEMTEAIPDALYASWKRGEFEFKDEPNFYISPEWNAKEQIIPKIVNYVQEHPEWKISIQTHKVMNIN